MQRAQKAPEQPLIGQPPLSPGQTGTAGSPLSLLLPLLFVVSCGVHVESEGGDSPDADLRASTDAGASADAANSSPDAQALATNATVTATTCLNLRAGPGTDKARVECTAPGSWCTEDNFVCIPGGTEVEVTGKPETGLSCTQWYPLNFETYAGYACGTYLSFPTNSFQGVTDLETLYYPADLVGPAG